MVDRTRSRLDIPIVRTLFGAKARPHRDRASGPPAQEVVIERPEYGLTWFKLHFGRLQLKAYTKGEHVLRFNGGLFESTGALPLNRKQFDILCLAASAESKMWSLQFSAS